MCTVKAIIFSCPPNEDYLEFRLIFDDGYEKYYKLDQYEIKAFRGENIRDIIEHHAKEYYEHICQPCETLKIIFF